MDTQVIQWNEPNRANTPPLHIASRGDRYSTVTGVWWLDEFRFVANHRSGLRLALFDMREGLAPVTTVAVPHLSDDVAARPLGGDSWELAVSGCWDASHSVYRLDCEGGSRFSLIASHPAPNRSFCHGVAYDQTGRLCLTYHTGEDPRILIGDQLTRLPPPWGARDICHDQDQDKYHAVAVSNNPQRTAYQSTSMSVWSLLPSSGTWDQTLNIDNVHSDACQMFRGRLWVPDQAGDRVLGLDLSQDKPPIVIQGDCFDFPHGLAISRRGMLAVTNYGSSSIVLLDVSSASN